MDKKLSQELLDSLELLNIKDKVVWEDGITNLTHVNHLKQSGINVPDEVLDYLEDTNIEGVFEEGIPDSPIFLGIDSSPKFSLGKTSFDMVISGSYFSPGNKITSDVIDILSQTYVNSHTFILNASTSGFVEPSVGHLFINGEKILEIETYENVWIDFRENGETINNYELLETETIVRDSEGIGSPKNARWWGSMIGIPEIKIPRDTNQGCEIVLKKQNKGSIMFGLIAEDHETDFTMQDEQHVGIYLQNQNSLWGFYAFSTEKRTARINSYNRIKLAFPTTLNSGSRFRVYGLTESDNWDDGKLIYEGTVPEGVQGEGDYVYPCLIYKNGSTSRLQAFKASYG